jgi:hypothetical protein
MCQSLPAKFRKIRNSATSVNSLRAVTFREMVKLESGVEAGYTAVVCELIADVNIEGCL